MTHLRIELAEGTTEYVSTSIVKKLYEIAISGTLDNTSNLLGTLHIPGGYAIYKTTLETMFPHFHLTMDNVYVPFNDPEFEKACVARFSSDGIGMTMADFLAVTTNAPLYAFNENTSITDMTEFKYFTNIPGDPNTSDQNYTGIPIAGLTNLRTIDLPDLILILTRHHGQYNGNYTYGNMFYGTPNLLNVHVSNNITYIVTANAWPIVDVTNCTSMTSCAIGGDTILEIYLPNSMLRLGSRHFFVCANLKKVVVCDGGTLNFTIVSSGGYDQMFNSNTSNVTVDFPSNTTQIHRQMFNGGKVSMFILRATTPPIAIDNDNNTTTSGMSFVNNTDLYVPDASVSLYQSNSIYSGFKSINGLSQLPASYDPTPPSLRLQSQS